jgi:hypothetical protein
MPTKPKTTKKPTAKPKAVKKPLIKPVTIKEDEEWQINEDLRTLQRAKEITADSKRMAKCQKLAEKQVKVLKDVVKAG